MPANDGSPEKGKDLTESTDHKELRETIRSLFELGFQSVEPSMLARHTTATYYEAGAALSELERAGEIGVIPTDDGRLYFKTGEEE